MQELSKGLHIMLVWAHVAWQRHRTLPLYLVSIDAWNMILMGVKSPLRMFRELNVFAVIL